jgi:hypothetical protein
MGRVAPKLPRVPGSNDPRGQTPTPLGGLRPPSPPRPKRPSTLRAYATGPRPATHRHTRPSTLRPHAANLHAAGGPQAPQPPPHRPAQYPRTEQFPTLRAVPAQQSSTPPSSHAAGPRRYALTQQSLDGYAPTNKPLTATRRHSRPRRTLAGGQTPHPKRPSTLRAYATSPRPAPRPHTRPSTATPRQTGRRSLRASIAGPDATRPHKRPSTLRPHAAVPRRSAPTQQALDGNAPTNRPPTRYAPP